MSRTAINIFSGIFLGWLCTLAPLALAVEDPAGLEQLKKTAESGDNEAMLELGILYEFGFRLQDHNAPALAWYRLASEAGNAKAGARLDALRAKLTAAEMDEANKLYTEYVQTVRKAPPAPEKPAAPAAATTPAPTPAPAPATTPTTAPTAIQDSKPTPIPAFIPEAK